MLKFITRFFAFIGFVTVALIVLAVVLIVRAKPHVEPEPASVVLSLDFTRPVVERGGASPFSLAFGADEEPMALFDILCALDHASEDPHVKGVVARFGTMQPSLVQAQEIRDALAHFRAKGKFSYAFGSDFGGFGMGNRAYFLASAFENVWLQPVGSVSLTGLAIQSPFGKTALDKIGVAADFMQREEYKSFMEPGQRDAFSPPVKAEMRAMIENLSDQIANGIAASRKWDVDHVKDLMARGPYTDEDAKQEGLVTRLAYVDELDEEMERKAGKDAKQVDPATYLSYVDQKDEDKDEKETKVALIYGEGLIMDKAFGGGEMAGERVMGADEIAQAFDEAAEDKDIKAILFRIDSPGGSPVASETIRRAMIRAQKKGKPVVVSMGDTAASGGYWIAMNGDKIVADPATITGSIGVVAGKFAVEGLMQKIGVSMDGVATSANAGMWSVAAPFTPEQRAHVNALLDSNYRSFVANVSAARKIPLEKMPDVAKGRVFTGDQAVKVGLVDALGGYDAAVKEVRKLVNIGDKAPVLLETFPAAPSPAEKLMKILQRLNTESVVLSSSASWLVRLHAAFRPLLSSLVLADAPVSARLPEAWRSAR